MDQSYWSRKDVVNATRDFVCIRLATYEDKKEVEFLSKIFRGRSGQLENTVFAILDSDGKTRLSRSGRSPDFAFRSRTQFVETLQEISRERDLSKRRFSDTSLPIVKNVDLALNVASCDKIQLLVVVGKDEAEVKKLSKAYLPLAWNARIGGQYVFATASSETELKPIHGAQFEPGLILVEPGQFGMSGKLVSQFEANDDIEVVGNQLADSAKEFKVLKEYRQHIRAGLNLGIEWESETPVTDRESNRATERARGR